MLYAELWTEENPSCRSRGSLCLEDDRFGYELRFHFLNEKPAEYRALCSSRTMSLPSSAESAPEKTSCCRTRIARDGAQLTPKATVFNSKSRMCPSLPYIYPYLAIHSLDIGTYRKYRHFRIWTVESDCKTGPAWRISFKLTPFSEGLQALKT